MESEEEGWECKAVARKTQSEEHLTAECGALVTEKGGGETTTTTTKNTERECGSFFPEWKKRGQEQSE